MKNTVSCRINSQSFISDQPYSRTKPETPPTRCLKSTPALNKPPEFVTKITQLEKLFNFPLKYKHEAEEAVTSETKRFLLFFQRCSLESLGHMTLMLSIKGHKHL